MLILGVDPGLCTGLCVYDTTKGQIWAGLMGDVALETRARYSNLCFIEKPRIYPGPRQHADPNDIVTLAVRAGEIAGRFKAENTGMVVQYVFPQDWKRGLDKKVAHARLLDPWGPSKMPTLTDRERGMIANVLALPESKKHNALDAIGIALFGAGRKLF